MEEAKPFLLGQVFSYTFKLLGKDFWKMFFTVFICIAIVMIPVAVFVVSFVLNPGLILDNFTAGDFYGMKNPFSIFLNPSIWTMYAVIIIVSLLVTPFMQGMVLLFSSSRIQGKPLAFKQAFSLAARKYGRLILTTLSGFVFILPFLAIYLLVYINFMGNIFSGMQSGNFSMSNMSSMFAMMPLMSLLNIVVSVVSVLLGIVFSFANCITINEDLYAFPAVLKGFKLLFKGKFWRNIGHYIVMGLTLTGFGIGFSLVMMILAIPAAFASIIAPIFIVLIVLLILGFTGFVVPFEATFVQLMYFNARLTAEGTMFQSITE